MLIDYTYFFHDCEIGQLDQQPIQDKLNLFIQKYEPEVLEGLLGYQTYRDFMAGLAQGTVDQKWLDLLNGAEYTDAYGKLKKWKGLLQLPSGGIVVNSAGSISVVVGRGQEFDPITGSSTTSIPTDFVGSDFVFMQRGFGPLRGDEYSVSGNVLTLLNGLKFSINDTYFFFAEAQIAVNSSADSMKISLIAYYVYYWYQRAILTNSGATGESKISTENAGPANASFKMATAWNKMVVINMEMYNFLFANQGNYPDWFLWSGFKYYPQWNYGGFERNTPYKFLTTINNFGF